MKMARNASPGRGAALIVTAAVLAGLLAGLIVSADNGHAANPAPTTPSPAETRRPTGPEMTIYGSFLAGRYAQSQRDLAAAADYVQRALSADPDDPQLLRRAYFLMASEGRMKEA